MWTNHILSIAEGADLSRLQLGSRLRVRVRDGGPTGLVLSEPEMSYHWRYWPVGCAAGMDRAAPGSIRWFCSSASAEPYPRPPQSPAIPDDRCPGAAPIPARRAGASRTSAVPLRIAGSDCSTDWKMEWQMLKRLHHSKVPHTVSSCTRVARPLRLELEWFRILLWRQKQMHPPSMT
jgi:hypothetical protein